MEEIGGPGPCKRTFQRLYWITQVVGWAMVALLFGIIFRYLGGLGWTDLGLKFHWHPLLMVFGMIFLYGNCEWSENETLN